MKKIFLLLTLALPMFMTTSCDDDESESEKKVENRYTDGVEYLKAKLFYHNEDGKVTGIALGECVMENEPSTAYVGVESQEDAQNLAISLFPADTGVKMADNITFTLTDTLGTKQGCAYYKASTTGESYGRLTFDDALGVDKKLLTSIVFIDNSLWPSNAPAGKSAISAGNIYKCNKEIKMKIANWRRDEEKWSLWFICAREQINGNPGILFADARCKVPVSSDFLWPRSTVEMFTTCYPSEHTLLEVHKDLNGANVLYWQQLAAITNSSVRNMKSRWYFTHTQKSDDDDIKKVCLGNGSTSWYNPPYNADSDDEDHACLVYFFKTETDGTTNIWLDGSGAWKEYQYVKNLSLSDLTKDADMMAKALTKNPNE